VHGQNIYAHTAAYLDLRIQVTPDNKCSRDPAGENAGPADRDSDRVSHFCGEPIDTMRLNPPHEY
jgi:hypothetical protein